MARSRLRRVSGARKALLRSLVTALFQHGSIVTTEAKAKELRHVADKMISLAKRGDLHARRQAEAFVMDKDVTKKLFDEIAIYRTQRWLHHHGKTRSSPGRQRSPGSDCTCRLIRFKKTAEISAVFLLGK